MSLFEYRPYIDGLRAVAVISVLLFHFHKGLLPGGFVGVDIFFVISGYLISSIIVNECQAGTFSFLRFYQRRVSRIFPVFFLVSLVTLITASFIYTSQDFASAGAVAIAATLSITNLKLLLQGNYFQLSPDAQPLLHFWSLSVEEQFYLVFPLLVYIAFKKNVSRRNLCYLLIALTVASFAACVALTTINSTWAFYLLPTRAWEILAGGILATYQHPCRVGNQKLDSILSNLGLLTLLISFFVIHEGMTFPGYIAAVPVLGTILIIGCSNYDRPLDLQSRSERFLSHPLLIMVGKLSYSLYLWHWPIFCFIDYSLYSYSFVSRAILKVTLTIALSLGSYYWIEKPIRLYLNQPKKQSFSFKMLSFVTIAFVAIGLFISNNNYINASLNNVKGGGISFNSSLTKPVVVLMGDSQGSMYGLALKEIASELTIRTHVISVAAGDPLPETQLYKDSLSFVERVHPDITIIAAAWSEKIGTNQERFKIALSALLQRSQYVIVLTQPPGLPQYASRQEIRTSGLRPIFEDTATFKLRKDTNTFLLAQRTHNVRVLDIEPLFKKSNGEIRFTDANGKQLYNDGGHLSGRGGELVKKMLIEEISRVLKSS